MTTNDFKRLERVLVVANEWDGARGDYVGQRGTVIDTTSAFLCVILDNHERAMLFRPGELAKVETKVFEGVVWASYEGVRINDTYINHELNHGDIVRVTVEVVRKAGE